MRRYLTLMLALLLALAVFAGCGEAQQDPPENKDTLQDNAQQDDSTPTPDGTQSGEQDDTQNGAQDGTQSDTQTPDEPTADDGIPELVIPWEHDPLNGSYISPEAEAIVTVAKSYLAREVWLQYDCSRLMKDLSGVAKVTRPQYHTNSPEDCTSQNTGYTNCSAFTYDVFWEAFGLDIKASGTNALRDAVDMHVFTYYITGRETAYERRLVEQNFLNSLQQGDIIACDHPSPDGGHALIYIGDGMMIDSAYFSSKGGGNYDHSSNHDRTEVNGSVRTREVLSFFEEDNYYYFWDEACWSVVRPLKKYTDAKITYKTQARVENLKDIYVEKLSSHALGQSADLGEEITFSFYIRNDRTTDASLKLTAQVPLGTEYVSGGDSTVGRSIKWDSVTVPAGDDVTVSYTVRVENDPALYGTAISGEGSAVGGVDVRCRDIYVGRHLNVHQTYAVAAAATDAPSMTERGIALADKVYTAAGVEFELPETETLLNSLFKQYESSTHYELNADSEYIDMVVPVMYGGYLCLSSELYAGERTYGIFSNQIYAGDILIAREKTNTYAYMMLDSNRILNLKSGKLIYGADTKETLLSLIGRDVFAVIRPSASN
ncbi:MAG: C40 family peptidase [Clostridia bacterium]|nr:C40 family peptidase [Clostridia bacterium]